MTHAERCPVCNGKGKILADNWISDGTEKTCHGCGGKGWIEVSDPCYTPYVFSASTNTGPWQYFEDSTTNIWR